MRRWILLWLAPALAIAAAAPVIETGSTLRPVDLKSKPFLDADTVAKLPERADLVIVTRQGPWMQVKTKDNKTGYVRLLQVRLNASDSMLAARPATDRTVAVASPLPGPSSATTTTGVRGFSEEDLKASKPNKAEYDKMKSLAVPVEQVVAMAASSQLAARSVPYYGEDGKPLKNQGAKK
jgi:hypothetical protein